MNALFARASLKRSSRTRTRKNSISISSDAGCPPSRSSSIVTHNHTRPLPLQIIPELSENDFEIDSGPLKLSIPYSDEPSRPSPRVTLSAFAFSIDDALLMLNDEPLSPALSASSSTDDSNSSASDDEDFCELRLPSPRLRPKRISIRPLCITKTRSIVCADDEDVAEIIEKDMKLVDIPEVEETQEEEDEYDFYTRQFQDFISLYAPQPSCVPISAAAPARPDSVILSSEDAPKLPVEAPKPRGRSRFSKALPLLPLPTPPPSMFPLPPIPQLSASAIRRKRVIPPMPKYPPPPPPSRPPPQMAVPSDIEELDISFEDEPVRSTVIEQVWFDDDEEESIYSQPSFAPAQENIHPISPAVPETPVDEMYLPRASIDSDTPRSSLESFSSSSAHSSSSSSESCPISPFSFPPTPRVQEKTHQLRSRWSSSTMSSLVAEPPRTILSPLRGVFGSKSKRPPPIISTSPRTQATTPTQTPYKMPLTRMVFPATPSPPSTPSRHIRRQNSRSSTSSAGWSECDSCDSGNSSSGLRRKPIPVEMFLRA
ncbi:uncharacterized protein EDB91DRAFT_1153794 [Suillus paluster]|uniref:uncharacterized protein n=1 Tax=Suillus paluster TaxID=48578 RepID=UPI001B86310D|nr:uncharacterized protein EDB91DRAFT_1153794 [Suillus paluster]KAG1731637.1 hypothetical protein EDB91DRAFT_1153794 [Suillus paluster]